MADYDATTAYSLIQLGITSGMSAGIDKQLVRFAIATGHTDPQLVPKLSTANPALLNFLMGALAQALYNLP